MKVWDAILKFFGLMRIVSQETKIEVEVAPELEKESNIFYGDVEIHYYNEVVTFQTNYGISLEIKVELQEKVNELYTARKSLEAVLLTRLVNFSSDNVLKYSCHSSGINLPSGKASEWRKWWPQKSEY